jgi:predicted nucleic acid-binding protein
MRVVIDTNLWISGLLWRGRPGEVLRLIDLSVVFDLPDPTAVIVTADPTDDVFLRCAVAAGAVYVLSGDHHLLDLKQYMSIPILTVHDFLSREFPS